MESSLLLVEGSVAQGIGRAGGGLVNGDDSEGWLVVPAKCERSPAAHAILQKWRWSNATNDGPLSKDGDSARLIGMESGFGAGVERALGSPWEVAMKGLTNSLLCLPLGGVETMFGNTYQLDIGSSNLIDKSVHAFIRRFEVEAVDVKECNARVIGVGRGG